MFGLKAVAIMKRLSSIVFVVFVAACGRELGAPDDGVTGAPRSGVTLRVTNGTCVMGSCDSLRVLAFPGIQPETPGGFWSLDLGFITTPEACFTLPASAKFYVITEPARSSADTTTYTWTSAIGLSLRAQAPSTPLLQASPSTTSFVPADAAGWSITLPADSKAVADSACTS
jgi:hypothetical protein